MRLWDFKFTQDERFHKLDLKTQKITQSLALTLQEAHTKLDQVLRLSSAQRLQLMHDESQNLANARELGRRADSIILRSLRFSTMNYRQEDICEAYQSTYKWILDENNANSNRPWSSLVHWLRSRGLSVTRKLRTQPWRGM